MEFCDRLSRETNKNYRLPSEAEWEYACRAETMTSFYYGEKLSQDLVNHRGTILKNKLVEGTIPVGVIGIANTFGLYDMHGNLYEWCLDYWHNNYDGAPTDGSAWLSDHLTEERIIRGGFWYSYPKHCRSAYRDSCEPERRSSTIGLRVVCDI